MSRARLAGLGLSSPERWPLQETTQCFGIKLVLLHPICPAGVCATLRCESKLGKTTPIHTNTAGGHTHQTHKPVELLTGPSAVPLDLNTLCSIHVVAFSVGSVILSVGGRSRLKVLGVLGEFHSFRLGPGLVTELYQSHRHGEAETAD